jgi:hypothetical protein
LYPSHYSVGLTNTYIFETFTFRSADGRLAELKPGGKNIPVTWQNRNEFIALAEHYRLNEFNSQTEALCRGVASIIPLHELFIFTWQELEFRVCAHAGVDLELLASRTEYPFGDHYEIVLDINVNLLQS